jgi:hypothetical protein
LKVGLSTHGGRNATMLAVLGSAYISTSMPGCSVHTPSRRSGPPAVTLAGGVDGDGTNAGVRVIVGSMDADGDAVADGLEDGDAPCRKRDDAAKASASRSLRSAVSRDDSSRAACARRADVDRPACGSTFQGSGAAAACGCARSGTAAAAMRRRTCASSDAGLYAGRGPSAGERPAGRRCSGAASLPGAAAAASTSASRVARPAMVVSRLTPPGRWCGAAKLSLCAYARTVVFDGAQGLALCTTRSKRGRNGRLAD